MSGITSSSHSTGAASADSRMNVIRAPVFARLAGPYTTQAIFLAALLGVACCALGAPASICPDGTDLLTPPVDVIDMTPMNAGPWPMPAQPSNLPLLKQPAQPASYKMNAIAVEPQTLRIYAGVTFTIRAVATSGSEAAEYSCDGLIVVPESQKGDNTAVLMTAIVSDANFPRSSSRVPLDSGYIRGTNLPNVVFAANYTYQYSPEFGSLYMELLTIRALLFTDSELLVVTQQQIFSVPRSALASSPTGATAYVNYVLPLPSSLTFGHDTGNGFPNPYRFDWTAAAWSPLQDRLYLATSLIYTESNQYSQTVLSTSGGTALFSYKRGTTWSTQPVKLGFYFPPGFSALAVVYSMAYVPMTSSSSGGRLVLTSAPVTSSYSSWAGVVRVTLSSGGDTTQSSVAELLGGRSTADGIEPADGTSALDAWLAGFSSSVVPLDSAGLTGALMLSGKRSSVVLWPNGTLGTIFGASPSTSVPMSAFLPVPLPAAGFGGTINAFLTTVGMYFCRPARAASVCPAGQTCTVMFPPQEPSRASCPRRLICPAGTLALPGLNISSARRMLGAQPCPQGSICVAGALMPQVCAAGFQCGQNSTHDIVEPCPRESYCPRGTHLGSDNRCNSGILCLGGAADKWGRPTGRVCPPGFRCKNNVPFPCPPGRWCGAGTAYDDSDEWSWDEPICEHMAALPVSFCRDFPDSANCSFQRNFVGVSTITPGIRGACVCPPGFLCAEGSSSPRAVPCPPGMACPLGSAFPASGCAPGYFCPEGSTNGEAHHGHRYLLSQAGLTFLQFTCEHTATSLALALAFSLRLSSLCSYRHFRIF